MLDIDDIYTPALTVSHESKSNFWGAGIGISCKYLLIYAYIKLIYAYMNVNIVKYNHILTHARTHTVYIHHYICIHMGFNQELQQHT